MKVVTLANLADSTKQEVFDHVLAHARKQQCKSRDVEKSKCLYRDGKGNACFAGALMTDEEHESIMSAGYMNRNVKAWGSMVREELVPAAHEVLIISLQQIHDHFGVVEWETRFAALAFNFNLTYTPVEGTTVA